MAPRLFWNAPASPDGAEFESLSAHGVPVRQGCSPVEGSDVSFPPPGGGVAVVPVGGGGLSEVRGTTDGQVLVWDAGAQTWAPGAGASSRIQQAVDTDDFLSVSGGVMTGSVCSLGVPDLPVQQTLPWWADLPWIAYVDNGQGHLSMLAGLVGNPGILQVTTGASGALDKVWCYRGPGPNSSRLSGTSWHSLGVLEHTWIVRGGTNGGAFRFGLFESVDFSTSAGTFNTSAFTGVGWLVDSTQAPNGNVWAIGGANDGNPYNADSGITAAVFNAAPLRRYTIRQSLSVPGTFEWLVDGVSVQSQAMPFVNQRLKPSFWIQTKSGALVQMFLDLYQTVSTQLTR